MVEHPDTNDPLRALEGEVEPPVLLEARVRRTLRARRLLRGRPWATRRRLAAIAAAAVIFAVGYAAGRAPSDAGPRPEGGTRYALFLYEDATFDTSVPEAELVAEYSAWAAELDERGQLEVGEKLAVEGVVLQRRADSVVAGQGAAASEIGMLSGLFVIRALSEAEALRIARTCPHLKYGGRVAVRAIVET